MNWNASNKTLWILDTDMTEYHLFISSVGFHKSFQSHFRERDEKGCFGL